MVALRKESVDRNYAKETPPHITQRSLSVRRAWIEMSGIKATKTFLAVALRKESVDRNSFALLYSTTEIWSLSVRRAWIEISDAYGAQCPD